VLCNREESGRVLRCTVLYSREENVCVLHNRKEIGPVLKSREEYACAVR
jgi:hypothetical protein